MTFLELAERVLQETQTPMKANDIWSYGVKKGYDKILGSLGKTPSSTLGALLYVSVRDNPNGIFDSIGSRPKKFVLKSLKLN